MNKRKNLIGKRNKSNPLRVYRCSKLRQKDINFPISLLLSAPFLIPKHSSLSLLDKIHLPYLAWLSRSLKSSLFTKRMYDKLLIMFNS